MLVALSLITLDPRVAGGAETFVRGLCGALRRSGVHEYHALVSRVVPDLADGLPTTVASSIPVRIGPARRLRSIVRPALLPGTLRDSLDRADVVHYPVTVPVPRARRAMVVTLHDLQHHDLPGLFDRRTRLFRRVAYDRAAQTADRVIVLTEWMRRRAVDLLELDPDRVHTIHHGVDLERFTMDSTIAREPFLLYPARGWPHKNHARLLEAFAMLRADRPELRLVLTGGGFEGLGAVGPGVEIRGRVSEDELVSLYRRAEALVFPSLYEGFGLPLVEAMACGCPVAASNAAAIPEVTGDAAVLFEPDDPEAIAAGVLEAFCRSDDLATAGLERARTFTWSKAAAAHDAVYALGAQR